MSVSITEARAFIEALHEVPEGENSGVPPDWRISPPHFLPTGLTRSVGLDRSSDWGSDDSTSTPFTSLSRIINAAYGVIGGRVYFPHVASTYFPGMAVGINKLVRPMVVPRRSVASGGATYPNDITVVIPRNATGYFEEWAGATLAYAPQYDRLFVLDAGEATRPDQPDFSLDLDDGSVALLVSLNLFRTYYKYRDFAFRLSAVDTGILIGRICGLALEDWDVRVDFKVDGAGLQKLIRREPATHPVYCAIVLKPKLRHAARADACCPRFEAHSPIAQGFKEESLRFPQFSERFASVHGLARSHRQRSATPRCDPPGSARESHGAARGCDGANPPSRVGAANDRRAHLLRRSRAQSFTGRPIEKVILTECVQSMQEMGSLLRSLADVAIAIPSLWITVLNVAGVEPGYYRVLDGTGDIEKVAALRHPKLLSDALYLKNFDVQKAGFVLHLGNRLFGSLENPDVSDYLTRQMTAGTMLDAGMLACARPDLSAHAFLGFSSRDVEAAYQVSDEHMRMLAQLCVGSISNGAPFDVSYVS